LQKGERRMAKMLIYACNAHHLKPRRYSIDISGKIKITVVVEEGSFGVDLENVEIIE
jgi:hypothetical protein